MTCRGFDENISEDDNFDDGVDDEDVISHLLHCCLMMVLMIWYDDYDDSNDHDDDDDENVISHLPQCCLMMVMIMTMIMRTATIMLIMKMQSHIFSNVDKFLGLEDIHREGFHNSVHFVQLLVHLLFSGDGLNFKKKHKYNNCICVI